MDRHIDGDYRKVNNLQVGLFCVYIFLSFFETYLTRFFGNSTKFYLLFVLALFLYRAKFKIKINKIWICYFVWFLYKFMSVLWSSMENADFSVHLLSQIGMLLFVIVLTGHEQDKYLIHAILKTNLWVSFLFGVLSILFRKPFLDEVFVARQVLTLFGLQNDPNNCAAFLLVGIVLGLYSATVERKRIVINSIIVAVNIYAMMLTSSRAGFLTLGVLMLCFVIIPQRGKRMQAKLIIQKLLIISAVVFITFIFVQQFLPQANIDRLFVLSEYEGGSGRDIRWQRAIELFLQRPIFGWGWGGYNTGVGAIHNTFLTSLCDIGMFGTLLFVIPIVMIASESLRQKNLLAFLILVTGVLPSIAIDAINKRFFWNAIVFSAMIVTYQHNNSYPIAIWESPDVKEGY